MSTAPRALGAPKGSKSGFSAIWRRLLAVPEARWPLTVAPAPVTEIPAPAALTFFLGRSGHRAPFLSPAAIAGAEVTVGQALGTLGELPVVPSPVAGTVGAVKQIPDVRGGKPGLAVVVEPSGEAAPAFEPLDPGSASPEDLWKRLREAGVELALPAESRTVVVLGADPEPGMSAAVRLFIDDPITAVRATRLLARLAGRALLAVLEPHAEAVHGAASEAGIEVLSLPPEYPAALPVVVARRVAAAGPSSAGANPADPGPTGSTPAAPDPAVVPLAIALDALAAVETGRVPASRVLTVVGSGGTPSGNYRVPIGTSLGEVFAAAGLEPVPGDKIVTGGPFRGLAQYSLDATVDATVDALQLVKAGTFATWSDEPCVNCGSCIDVCPEDLQAHHLARYSEFGLFDRTPEYGLHDCIECGLCATVCPARRPLLQRIRLAKREIAVAAAAEVDALAAISAGQPAPVREPDPIPVPVATAKKE